ANCDMVGHTGVMDAAVKAVETVDECVGRIVAAARDMGGIVLITADHGNADSMQLPDGSPNTAHTTNPVPLILVGADVTLRPGRLADIAPTMLELMGFHKPSEMTGESLIVK
ncbi:MAG: 2,3-bisphosphoglycerate-independent phosphoglycerate mutase, partial [Oscillospiraceae bacterium]